MITRGGESFRAFPRAIPLLPFLLATGGCGLLFPESPVASPSSGPAVPPTPSDAEGTPLPPPLPSGFGSLRQEEISIELRRGELQIRVTPLEEEVLVLTAPDTYERLSALARGYQEFFVDRTGSAIPFRLVLVSLHTEANEVTFEPEGLHLVNRGLRHRPVEVRPLTPGWGTQTLRPREFMMAVYAFPIDVDLTEPTEVEYLEVRSRDWDRILPLLERERVRVRARQPPSSPNF